MQFTLTPRGLGRFLAGAIATLVALHLAVHGLAAATGHPRLFGLVHVFNLGAERNLPTAWSGATLLACGVLLLLVGLASRGRADPPPLPWYGLAAVFGFLAMDEVFMLHEALIRPLREGLGTSGLLYYAWVLPYGLALGLLGTFYVPFLRRLPRRTAAAFVVSGVVFVTGAIGFEALGGLVFEREAGITPLYVVLQTLEETLEMSGVALFLVALTRYAGRSLGGLDLRLALDPAPAPQAAELPAPPRITELPTAPQSASRPAVASGTGAPKTAARPRRASG